MLRSEDHTFGGTFRLLVTLLGYLVVQLEECVLLSIIGVNDISDLHELVVIHIEQVVLNARLIDDIRVRLDSFHDSWQSEAHIVAHEVERRQDQLVDVKEFLRHLTWCNWLSIEGAVAFLTELVLELSNQVVAEGMHTVRTLHWVSHLKHHGVVLCRYLSHDREGVKVSPDFVHVRRVKDGLDEVKVQTREVILVKLLRQVRPLHNDQVLGNVASQAILLSLQKTVLKSSCTLQNLILVETQVLE